jgi:tetratricopeptide (TPR) repeat protein
LHVTARTSSFSFRGKEADVRRIGAELNVENILEGSVRRAGSRIRITVQLVNTADGYHLWSERFDRDMTDVFAIQDEISLAIVNKLRVQLSGDRPLVIRSTENMEAYNLYLRGVYHLAKLNHEKCMQYLEQAIALDSKFAQAYVEMAVCLFSGSFWHMNPNEALPKARAAALEALKLDDTLADAHGALAMTLGFFDFDWKGAEREFQCALKLNPASPTIRFVYVFFLQATGQLGEAVTEMRRLLEQDPLNPLFNAHLGYLWFFSRQNDRAIEQQLQAIELDPNSFYPYSALSLIYLQKGQLDEAIRSAEKACELSGRSSMMLGQLGACYGLAGRTAASRQLLEELKARSFTTYVPALAPAFIHACLGELEQYLELIGRAAEEREMGIILMLKTSPHFDSLRPHPSYQALLRKMNLM